MICILIEIISLRSSRVVLFFTVNFLYVYSFSMFSTLLVITFLALHAYAKFSPKKIIISDL